MPFVSSVLFAQAARTSDPSLYNPLAIASKPFPAIYSEKILIFTIFSAFAEFERDMIVERTQEGKMLAKQNPDFREGRPKSSQSSKSIMH